jgi:hypothetical protein
MWIGLLSPCLSHAFAESSPIEVCDRLTAPRDGVTATLHVAHCFCALRVGSLQLSAGTEYVLRCLADDGGLWDEGDVTVTVEP